MGRRTGGGGNRREEEKEKRKGEQDYSQDFPKGGYMNVHVCMHKHGRLYSRVWGHAPYKDS